ncbi:MAG: hypothetical protein A2381_01635 [Bdellovibrionales bacterium RIFOXYB1_FULL_37_110]|nr:MAG: hypothetical protein A2417_15880 [Bdellovibrionales bacterium RIFOXYC1_FULL_37_79]OFZ58917.1 MAG: hypothetical protein A2381_01635 [Bdellovibrionales bacterium RIFOXYB1_FULL_37_110]OFZ64637.1 MAG: hypothetical protein A2577_13300 [Bdellovibrionales bacterium RIFOXYD1_FULL_36_51]
MLIATKFQARENDSRLYTIFVTQLTLDKPLSEIVALEWRGQSEYADPHNPYVRDHFIGQFIFPVILSKLGFPSEYSLYFLNTLYRLLLIFMLYLIVKEFIEKETAIIILWALPLTPINFSYQLRANHEQLLSLCIALCVLGLIKINKGILYQILFITGFVFSFLTKGLAAIILFPTLAFIWFVLYFKPNQKKMTNLVWLIFSFLVLLLVFYLYELWFKKVTGYPLIEAYYQIQIYERSLQEGSTTNSFLMQKIGNFLYYISRTLINGLPWSLLLIVAIIIKYLKTKKLKSEFPKSTTMLIWILASFPVIYILLFSISDRLAQRYIFPAYYFFNTLILVILIQYSPALKKFQQYLNSKIKPHYILIWMWFLLIVSALGMYFLKGGHNHWIS